MNGLQEVPAISKHLTATAIRDMNEEYWQTIAPVLQRREAAIQERLVYPLFDRMIRMVLKMEGLSYRKFMFNQPKVKFK